MRGLVPARIPVHKTRKVQLNSHIDEYRILCLGYNNPVQKEFIRNLFQTPNLDSFYQHGNLMSCEVIQ
ncbi:MAG TPA: hypothetical protein VGK06_15215 [Methanosarcina sp.]